MFRPLDKLAVEDSSLEPTIHSAKRESWEGFWPSFLSWGSFSFWQLARSPSGLLVQMTTEISSI